MSATNQSPQLFPCMLCYTPGRAALCRHCLEEVDARNQVTQKESQMVQAHQAAVNAHAHLHATREELHAARNQLHQLERRRTQRRAAVPLPVTPDSQLVIIPPGGAISRRGRVTTLDLSQEDTPPVARRRGREEVEETAEIRPARAGLLARSNSGVWLSRRRPRSPVTTPVESSDDEAAEGEPCMVCMRKRRGEPVESRCRRTNCTYQTCLPCWTQCGEMDNPRCPGCRATISEEENSDFDN